MDTNFVQQEVLRMVNGLSPEQIQEFLELYQLELERDFEMEIDEIENLIN